MIFKIFLEVTFNFLFLKYLEDSFTQFLVLSLHEAVRYIVSVYFSKTVLDFCELLSFIVDPVPKMQFFQFISFRNVKSLRL